MAAPACEKPHLAGLASMSKNPANASRPSSYLECEYAKSQTPSQSYAAAYAASIGTHSAW